MRGGMVLRCDDCDGKSRLNICNLRPSPTASALATLVIAKSNALSYHCSSVLAPLLPSIPGWGLEGREGAGREPSTSARRSG